MSETPDIEPILTVKNLRRSFSQGGQTLNVLNNVNFNLHRGEMVALVGPSGSGKSTLLQCVGLLDTFESGTVRLGARDVIGMNDAERTLMRRLHIGFIYQFHNLQPEFSALENVMLPQLIADQPADKAAKRAQALLERVGLKERVSHRPARLSGGEQQRVAVARALANGPGLLLADEPTGNLDPETADDVFDLLMQMIRRTKSAALIATHNMELADRMDRVLELKNGSINA